MVRAQQLTETRFMNWLSEYWEAVSWPALRMSRGVCPSIRMAGEPSVLSRSLFAAQLASASTSVFVPWPRSHKEESMRRQVRL